MADDSRAGGAGNPRSEGNVGVIGVPVGATLADPEPDRPCAVVVTDSWGSEWDEGAAAARLVAGALALSARVLVLRLPQAGGVGEPLGISYDSLFPVYSGGSPVEGIERILAEAPTSLVLAGAAALSSWGEMPAAGGRPRIVALPLVGVATPPPGEAVRAAARRADAIGGFSGLEAGRLRAWAGAGSGGPPVHHLRLALPVNPAAASTGVVGVSDFGRYVLVLSGFEGGEAGACPPHDYLRHVVGDVAIAEVRPGPWIVTAPGRHMEMPWPATRMNLWRMMAHAAMTVDLRSRGPVGREAIESLRLGTPVVVPDASAASEHAAASNGGLWYRNHGEMADAVKWLLDEPSLGASLGKNGREWADRTHGDTVSFVRHVAEMVLAEAGGRSP